MTAPSGISSDDSRLFCPFLDEVDMICCVAADTTVAEVNQTAAGHGLRFPLVLDPARTLREHVAAAELTPASARFGPYVDNLPGMNWELPAGEVIRAGERVVKSTTGYDLFRFLLHGDGRYGRPVDFVLRLRPVGGESMAGRFDGPPAALDLVRKNLRGSSWNHWIDRIDYFVDEGEPRIEVEVDCLPGESVLFKEFFQSVAAETGSTFHEQSIPAAGGIPSFTIKCTPGLAPKLAQTCVDSLGGHARALLINGGVLAWPDKAPDPGFVATLGETVGPLGGHLFGQALPVREPNPAEAAWAEQLETEWSRK